MCGSVSVSVVGVCMRACVCGVVWCGVVVVVVMLVLESTNDAEEKESSKKQGDILRI